MELPEIAKTIRSKTRNHFSQNLVICDNTHKISVPHWLIILAFCTNPRPPPPKTRNNCTKKANFERFIFFQGLNTTDDVVENDQMNVFAVYQHSHLLGRKMK